MWAQGGSRDVINKIIRYYFDGKEDYRLAAGRCDGGDICTELNRLVDEREQFHTQLQQAISKLGIEGSDNGTAAADFKRDWERLRGGIAGHGFDAALGLADQSDANALEQINLLAERDLPPEIRELLNAQADRLQATRTRVFELRPSTT